MSNMSSRSRAKNCAGGRVYGCGTGTIHVEKGSPICKNRV